MAEERAVLSAGRPVLAGYGRVLRVEQHDIRCLPGRQLAGRQTQGAGRAVAEAGDKGRQVEQAVLHQRHRQRQQQFDAADTRFGSRERRVLGVLLVRLVVAGDGLDHAALHRFAQCFAVGQAAQRRLYVVQAGEVAQRFIGEDQLVHRYVGGNRQAALLGAGDQFDAARAGQLAEVSAYAGLLHQQQVAGKSHGFGGFRDAGQAAEARGWAVVGEAALGQLGVLRGEHHCQVESRRVLQ
ncbi:hypothetical protein D3C76_667000 [compost metagenome]